MTEGTISHIMANFGEPSSRMTNMPMNVTIQPNSEGITHSI